MTHRTATRRFVSCALSALLVSIAGCGSGAVVAATTKEPPSPAPNPLASSSSLTWPRQWYLFPELLPSTVDAAGFPTAESLLDHLTATARAATQGSVLQLPDDAQRRELAARRRVSSSASGSARAPIRSAARSSPRSSSRARPRKRDCSVATRSSRWMQAPASCRSPSGWPTASTISDALGPAEAGVRRGLRLLRDGNDARRGLSRSVP